MGRLELQLLAPEQVSLFLLQANNGTDEWKKFSSRTFFATSLEVEVPKAKLDHHRCQSNINSLLTHSTNSILRDKRQHKPMARPLSLPDYSCPIPIQKYQSQPQQRLVPGPVTHSGPLPALALNRSHVWYHHALPRSELICKAGPL